MKNERNGEKQINLIIIWAAAAAAAASSSSPTTVNIATNSSIIKSWNNAMKRELVQCSILSVCIPIKNHLTLENWRFSKKKNFIIPLWIHKLNWYYILNIFLLRRIYGKLCALLLLFCSWCLLHTLILFRLAARKSADAEAYRSVGNFFFARSC